MAVVWQKRRGNRYYKVTKAGASVRLYTNGVFHSQFNPNNPAGGNIWDLLFVPALMHPTPHALKRVLVLGVGGGAVIRQLNCFLAPQHIVGVELDPVHLQVARRYFKVTQPNVELVQAEAREWLSSYRGPRFDLIIEDLFTDAESPDGTIEPLRAIAADEAWFKLLDRRLSNRGVLVMNFESSTSLRQSDWRSIMGSDKTFASALRLSHTGYENTIGVFLRVPQARQQFEANLAQFRSLDRRRSDCKLQFHYRKL